MEIVYVSLLVVATIALLVTEWLPIDVTALGIMVALALPGVLTPSEALAGFANPAPITVGALFIVSRSLVQTGALDLVADKMVAWTAGRAQRLALLSLVFCALFSAFLNNTPVVILFLTVVMAVCCKNNWAPSKFLMPISFVSILAGTTTLIGTSTNLLVSDLGASLGCQPIGMFELAAAGAPILVVGGLYLLLIAPRLLSAHKLPVCEMDSARDRRYLSELLVTDTSSLIGQTTREGLVDKHLDLELYEVVRGDHILDPQAESIELSPGDRLLVKASAGQLMTLVNSKDVTLPHGRKGRLAPPTDHDALLVELLVPPNSPLEGHLLKYSGLLDANDLELVGLKRRQVHYARENPKLTGLRMLSGDILLVQCAGDCIQRLRAAGELVVLEDVVHAIRNTKHAPLAVAVFAAMVLSATTGLLSISVAALSAAFLLIVTGCIRLRHAYQAVDVKVLLLIIGTLAMGTAIKNTGAADLYAGAFLSLFQDAPPTLVLAGIIVLTSLLSHVLSNNATAVLMVPVALSTATALGVDPRPFLIGICFGASACFGTPFGYQTNLLVHGPGGYRFCDYLKAGLPLNVIVWVGASLLVPVFWPL